MVPPRSTDLLCQLTAYQTAERIRMGRLGFDLDLNL